MTSTTTDKPTRRTSRKRSRRTTLKRTQRGYVRNLGRKPDGTQPKFYLGHDREEAVVREERLVVLWEHIRGLRIFGGLEKSVWTDEYLEAAKAIAKGESPKIPKGDHEFPDEYEKRIRNLSKKLGEAVPLDAEEYEKGVESRSQLHEIWRAILKAPNGTNITGQTLHQALHAYQDYIEREFQDQKLGEITDNGKSKWRQVKTIIEYVPDADLGSLNFSAVDEVFGVFRRRPKSRRYGTMMTRKSCSNYLGELKRFFNWLHRESNFDWRKPEDFNEIRVKPHEFDADVIREVKEIETWTVDELTVINEYATSIERMFFLLGLNGSYGADQAGRLEVGDLNLSEDGESVIRRIRRKKKTLSIHLMWHQTEAGVRWAFTRREKQGFDSEFLLLTEDGHPYWRKTKGGNRSQAIPRLWRDLFQRIWKDHPSFRWLPYNSLRDTSANIIRNIAGHEVASVHLAHKHQSPDENLGRYTNPIREKHFDALREMERQLRPVFDAAGPEPWRDKPKTYIGRDKVKRLLTLHKAGVPARKIAEQLDISASTVYRNLDAYNGKK